MLGPREEVRLGVVLCLIGDDPAAAADNDHKIVVARLFVLGLGSVSLGPEIWKNGEKVVMMSSATVCHRH